MSDIFVAFLVVLAIASAGTFAADGQAAFGSAGCDRYFGISICW